MPDSPRIGTAILDIRGDFSTVNQEAAAFSAKLGKTGKLAAGVAGVAAAAGLAAKALHDIGDEFDGAYDKIRTGTGKTGKQLDRLKNDFRSVVGTVPADFDSASTAIADLNKRLGVSGKPLRNLSRQFLELSRITESDLQGNIQTVTRLFGDWGVQTRKQPKTLDKLFRASQATGIEISKLSEYMVQFGSPLRQMGFDFDTAAAMFSKFEKEGVNLQTAMPGLRMALKNFSKEGKDPAKGLQETISKIEGMGSAAKANTLAFEVFGTRAGPDLAAAIREGRFDFDQLIKTIRGGGDTIRKAGKETMDGAEGWQLTLNKLKLLVEPLATAVFDAWGKLGQAASEVDFQKVARDLGLTKATFEDVGDAVSALAKFVGPVLGEQLKAAGQYFKGLVQVVRGVAQVISGILTGDFGKAWKGVKNIFGGGVKMVLGSLRAMTAPFRAAAGKVADALTDKLGGAWDWIEDRFEDGLDKIKWVVDKILDVVESVPGVPDFRGGDDGKKAVPPAGPRGPVGGQQHRFSGGPITKPTAIVGEEAPRHHEWVIATNPAYKRDNLRYWAQAGKDLGVPGFAVGGLIGKGADFLTSKLPSADIPAPFSGLGPYLIGQVTDWIKGQFQTEKLGDFQGLGRIVRGKVSYFNGPASTTASGISVHKPGLALNIHPGTDAGWDNATTRGWIARAAAGDPVYARTTIAGHTAKLPITDLGPSGFTGRAIDVTEAGVRKLGLNPATFPTDSIGTAVIGRRKGGPLFVPRRGARGGNPYDPAAMRGGPASAPHFLSGTGFPARTLDRIKAKAASIAKSFTGYVWGGGHGEGTNVRANGLDCSGAVARLLQESGWPVPVGHSSTYETIFHPGKGQDFTIWSNDRHTFAEIAGKMWGTNSSNGLGYHSHTTAGFVPRHPSLASEGTMSTVAAAGKGSGTAPKSGLTPGYPVGITFGPLPETVKACTAELHLRRHQLRQLEKAKREGGEGDKTLEATLKKVQKRIDALVKRRAKIIKDHRKRVAKSIADRGLFPKLAKLLVDREGAYELAAQNAERIAALEPENPDAGYVAQERGAWTGVLGTLSQWRDSVVGARDYAASRIPEWARQIREIEAWRVPGMPKFMREYKRLKWRIPALRKAITNASGFIGDRGDNLTSLQGLGGPQGMLGDLGEGSPYWLTLGGPGSRIFDTQATIRALDLRAVGGDGAGDSERAEVLEKLLRESNLRTAVAERQFKVLRDFPHAGTFHTGGIVPGPAGAERMATVKAGEGVFTPEQMAAMGGGGVQVVINGDIVNTPPGVQPVEVLQGGRRLRDQIRTMPIRSRRTPGGAR